MPSLVHAAAATRLARRSLLVAPVLLAAPCQAAPALDDTAFYTAYPYVEPADILPFLEAQTQPGDADGLLAAMDAFASRYPMYGLGQVKGEALEAEARKRRPAQALEVGTFLGYSAVRTARSLAPGGRLLCVEASPQHAAVATWVLKRAGLADCAEVLVGLSSKLLPAVAARLGPAGADWVFLDHAKECYLEDTLALEALGVIRRGTLVAADNVVYPGAPGYLEHMAAPQYATRLVEAPVEYEQVWRKDWVVGKTDAISFSTKA